MRPGKHCFTWPSVLDLSINRCLAPPLKLAFFYPRLSGSCGREAYESEPKKPTWHGMNFPRLKLGRKTDGKSTGVGNALRQRWQTAHQEG